MYDIIWIDRYKRRHHLQDLKDNHLNNIINMLESGRAMWGLSDYHEFILPYLLREKRSRSIIQNEADYYTWLAGDRL